MNSQVRLHTVSGSGVDRVDTISWYSKEWAKLFLKNWNRAVELWDNGHMFRVHVDEYQPYQLRDQQEYARLCCAWIIPNGMAEPHVVAEGG